LSYISGIAKTIGVGLAATGATIGLTALDRKSVLDAFGTSLYFPSDLGSVAHPHYISFSFREYRRRSIFEQPFLEDIGMIRLPIPNNLIDAQEVNYNQTDNSLIGGAIIENMLTGTKNVADIARNITAAGRVAGGGVAAAAIASAAPDRLLQLGGLVQNPFLTVLFKSPTFKRYQFSWTLAPDNPQEAEIMANIINKFKYHQLPGLSHATAGTLLSYPDMAIVQLFPDDRYLFKFKPCVIEGVTINYTPGGQPSFTSIDSPNLAILTISILEIEYWTKDDVLRSQGISVPTNPPVVSPPTGTPGGTNPPGTNPGDLIFQ